MQGSIAQLVKCNQEKMRISVLLVIIALKVQFLRLNVTQVHISIKIIKVHALHVQQDIIV